MGPDFPLIKTDCNISYLNGIMQELDKKNYDSLQVKPIIKLTRQEVHTVVGEIFWIKK
jgi:hypothetical protein